MANNTSVSCDMSESFWAARSIAYTFAYYVTPPIMVTVGLGSHIVTIIALYKEARKHFPFWYQVFDMASTATSIITFAIAIGVFRVWSGFGSKGAAWFMNSYCLMWYTAHLAFPLVNAVGLIGLYWSAAVAADRAFAMTKPLAYTGLAHRKRIKIMFCGSIFIGISASAFDIFRYYVSRGDRSYILVVNDAFVSSSFAKIAVNVRNITLGLGVSLLIASNVRALVAFWCSNNRTGGVLTDKRLQERKKTEKTLLCLTLIHGIEELLVRTAQIATFAIGFARPSFLLCENLLVAPLVETMLQWVLLTRVFSVACVSAPFRVSLLRVLRGQTVLVSVSPGSAT